MIGNAMMDTTNTASTGKPDQQQHRLMGSNGLRPSSGMTSPTPSTVKMNGNLHQQQQQQQHSRHQLLNVSALNSSKLSHASVATGKQMFDISSREHFSHSLHDTSQELSRSALSSVPRLRTPNSNLTPTPVLIPSMSTNPGSSSVATSNATSLSPPSNTNNPNPNNSIHSRVIVGPTPAPCNGCHRNSSVQDVLASLALLAVVSVLLAFLAVLFLTKVMAAAAAVDGRPFGGSNGHCNVSTLASQMVDASEYRLVYEVVVGLTTCTISLDFTCLLICCAQFLFASKLTKSSNGSERASQYLRQSSFSRVIAVGGFFISIPVLLTGIILYAFLQFEAKPAIITSLLLGLSIIFCGFAMIHNVYVWQREKTKASFRERRPSIVVVGGPVELKVRTISGEQVSNQGGGGMDTTQNASMELSTLV